MEGKKKGEKYLELQFRCIGHISPPYSLVVSEQNWPSNQVPWKKHSLHSGFLISSSESKQRTVSDTGSWGDECGGSGAHRQWL